MSSYYEDLINNRETAKKAAAEAEAAEAKRSDAADAFNMRLDDFVSQYRKWAGNNKDAKYSKATDDELKERVTGLIQKAGVADEQINSGDTNSYDYYKYGVDFLNGMDSQKGKFFNSVKNKVKSVSELSDSDKDALAEAAKFEDNYKKYRNGEIQDWRAGIDQEKAAKGMQVRKDLDAATRKKNRADNANDFFDIFENYESYMTKDDGKKNESKEDSKAGANGTTDSDTVEFTLTKANDPNYKGFGQKIVDLGLATENGLWGENGDVAYYTKQLNDQGIYGNLPIGKTIRLKRRK